MTISKKKLLIKTCAIVISGAFLGASAAAYADSPLEDEQIGKLRTLSQSLLNARLARKQVQSAAIATDRLQLRTLADALDSLESQASNVLYWVERPTAAESVPGTVSMQLKRTSRVESVHLDPATSSFVPDVISGTDDIATTEPRNQVIAAAKRAAHVPSPITSSRSLQDSLAQVRARINHVKEMVQANARRTPQPTPISTAASTGGETASAVSRSIPSSTVALLTLIEKLDQSLSALPTDADPQTVLAIARILKKRLKLTPPAMRATPVEPTVTTRTRHR